MKMCFIYDSFMTNLLKLSDFWRIFREKNATLKQDNDFILRLHVKLSSGNTLRTEIL